MRAERYRTVRLRPGARLLPTDLAPVGAKRPAQLIQRVVADAHGQHLLGFAQGLERRVDELRPFLAEHDAVGAFVGRDPESA